MDQTLYSNDVTKNIDSSEQKKNDESQNEQSESNEFLVLENQNELKENLTDFISQESVQKYNLKKSSFTLEEI